MFKRRKRAIVLCEAGWMGARELSLFLARHGVEVEVLIAGFIERRIRKMITSYSNIHNTFIPKRIYNLYLFFYLIFISIFYNTSFFVSTNKMAKKRIVRFLGAPIFFIREKANSYYINDHRQKEVSPELILNLVN